MAPMDDSYATSKAAYGPLVGHVHGVVWDPFYFDGRCKAYMQEVFPDCTILHEDRDCTTWQPDTYDMIVTNPPYSKTCAWLKWLLETGKPFCALMPASVMSMKRLRAVPGHELLSVIVPAGRVHFEKPDRVLDPPKFNAVWYCRLPGDAPPRLILAPPTPGVGRRPLAR